MTQIDRSIETHLAALVFARLVTEQVIPIDDSSIARCLRALGIELPLVRDAVTLIRRHGWRPLAAEVVPASFHMPAEESDGINGRRRAGRKPAPRRITPRRDGEPEKRTCARCGEVKPIEEFRWRMKNRRADGTAVMARDSYDFDCRREFQRELTLTGRQKRQLAALGLDHVGDELLCVVCGQPIKEGRPGWLAEVVAHEGCMPGACGGES